MTERDRTAFHRTLYECLGRIISSRRKKLGLSQEELANEASVDRAFISKIESGRRKPSFGLVSNIAHGLKMRYSRLVHNCEECVEMEDKSA
jgi:transcriptional regulator with XRE-family HTH domain